MQKAIDEKNYENVSKNYRLIRNEGVKLIVPCRANCALFHKIRDAEKITKELLRAAAPITISCFDIDYVKRIATPIKIGLRGTELDTGYYILNRDFENYYDPVVGFKYDKDSYDVYMI